MNIAFSYPYIFLVNQYMRGQGMFANQHYSCFFMLLKYESDDLA